LFLLIVIASHHYGTPTVALGTSHYCYVLLKFKLQHYCVRDTVGYPHPDNVFHR